MNASIPAVNTMREMTIRSTLTAECRAYRVAHNRAPHIYSVPSAREEAGRHLQADHPLDSLRDSAPQQWDIGYWSHVRSWIRSAMAEGRKRGGR